MSWPEVLSSSKAVPLSAASPSSDYPQFAAVPPPSDGLTVEAWQGSIQPFADDDSARFVLSEIEADHILWISAGEIRAEGKAAPHWAHPLLVNMAVKCEVLVCIQPEAMPRAYLLNPRFETHYEQLGIHPHPRGDQSILHGRSRVPGLCVFSSAEVAFDPEISFFTQFLDLVTQYAAKHLIWLRTRRLYRLCNSQRSVLYQPRPGELIIEQPPVVQPIMLPNGPAMAVDYWSGYWPGKAAKATTPLQHVQQIRPKQRCWCGLNKQYAQCHRSFDLSLLPPREQRRFGGSAFSV